MLSFYNIDFRSLILIQVVIDVVIPNKCRHIVNIFLHKMNGNSLRQNHRLVVILVAVSRAIEALF